MTEKEWREQFVKIARRLMREKNIDQRELSRRSGVSEASLSRYLLGKRTPNGYVLDKILNSLK